jgi:hypothetical protein
LLALAFFDSASAAWPTTQWEIVCTSEGSVCDSKFSEQVLKQLTDSGIWLEASGYEQPEITRRGLVSDSSEPLPAFLGEADICGSLAACYGVDGYGFLPNYYNFEPLGLGDAWAGTNTIKIGTMVRDNPKNNASAPTHELFHAIQWSYGLHTKMNPWLWFVEATAAAVEEEHYARHYGTTFGAPIDRHNRVLIAGRPYYDYPLDKLPNPMFNDPKMATYVSYLFWKFVGESLYGGDTVVGLRMLFDALDVGGEPIAQIDAALKKLGRGGLSVHYPEFIAKRAEEPFDYEKQGASLKVFDGSDEDKKDETEGTVDRLAAQFHLVTADPGPGEDAKLEIRLVGEDSFHLIVDDKRYDGGTGSSGSEKNVFRARLEELKTYTVRVANVAQDAASTSEQPYTLKVRMVNEPADCCSCAFDSTEVYAANGDFQCSFAYPAGWEVSYDRWENWVLVKAPRCEKRCNGARSMSVRIGTGKDNNWEVREQGMYDMLQNVGKGSCGGRTFPFFRTLDSKPDKLSGALNFYVGNNDDKVYGGLAQFACPEPGGWQELERLLIDSFK